MYPQELVNPMKADLSAVGFEDLVTAADVDIALTPVSYTHLEILAILNT